MSRSFLRPILFLAATILCGASAPLIAATPYTDGGLGFAVDVPDEWIVASDKLEADLLIQQGNIKPGLAQKCFVAVDKIAVNATQQQLDDRYAAEWQTAAYWERYISIIAEDAKLLSHGISQGRHVRGGRAEFTYNTGKGVSVQAINFRYFTPQKAFSLQCMGPATDFETARKDIEQFLTSLHLL
jgi:hypothetical protein